MENCKLYTLNHPITNEIRYVGYTSSSLKERLRCHLKDVDKKSTNCHRNKWIRFLRKENLIPTINLIQENLTKQEAIQLEIKTISEYKLLGINLTNNTNGGEGGTGYKFSKEQRIELAKKMTGKKFKPCSEERKRKISQANKGRKLTDEQKAKMSIAIKKRFENPQERLRLSKINKGKKLSAETKKKMSDARKKEWENGTRNSIGWTWTEERKNKMSENFTGKNNPFFGKHHSREVINKIAKKNIGNKYSCGKRTPEQIQKMKQGKILAKEKRNYA